MTTESLAAAPGTGPGVGPSSNADTPNPSESPVRPTVGRDVHHVARGSADGHYAPEIRPAKITRVHGGYDEGDGGGTPAVSLVVWTEEGQFWPKAVSYHGGVPDAEPPFSPYYRCPVTGLAYPGGTWHWPPRV